MSGSLLWDIPIWFFALAGAMLMLCDIVQYFIYKDALPQKMCILIPDDTLRENCRPQIANLLNLLYDKNPAGDYELIILSENARPELSKEIGIIADAADCVYIANADNAAAYIKQCI